MIYKKSDQWLVSAFKAGALGVFEVSQPASAGEKIKVGIKEGCWDNNAIVKR